MNEGHCNFNIGIWRDDRGCLHGKKIKGFLKKMFYSIFLCWPLNPSWGPNIGPWITVNNLESSQSYNNVCKIILKSVFLEKFSLKSLFISILNFKPSRDPTIDPGVTVLTSWNLTILWCLHSDITNCSIVVFKQIFKHCLYLVWC